MRLPPEWYNHWARAPCVRHSIRALEGEPVDSSIEYIVPVYPQGRKAGLGYRERLRLLIVANSRSFGQRKARRTQWADVSLWPIPQARLRFNGNTHRAY